MFKHLQPLLLPASITLLLFALTYGLGRWNGGGAVTPVLTRAGHDYYYILTAEGRQRLPEQINPDWLNSLGLSLGRASARDVLDGKGLIISTTPQLERRFAAWMDENLGPDNWRYDLERTFDLTTTVRGGIWGLESQTKWYTTGRPNRPLLSSIPISYLNYGFNRGKDRVLINRQHLKVTTQRLCCIGPVWPALLLLCGLPVFLLHFLRRPLLRMLTRRPARP